MNDMIDFRQYWSAFQLATAGLNPYQPEIMHAFQQSYFGDAGTIMMWNPPWLLVILLPILWMDYWYAELVWSGINFAVLTGSIFLLLKEELLSSRLTRKVMLILLMATFPPLIDCLKFGQLGLLLLIGSVFVYLGVPQGRTWSTVLGLCLLSIKPHLFVICGAFLFSWFLATGRFAILIKGFLGISLISFLTNFVFQGSLYSWIVAMIDQPTSDLIFRPWQWKTATISTLLRDQFLLQRPDLGYSAVIFVWLFALTPILFLSGFWIRGSRFEVTFPLLICLSLILSPFTWYFDMTVLLICYPMMIRSLGVSTLLAFHVLVFGISELWLHAQHQFWWFSLVVMFLYLLSMYFSKDAAKKGSTRRMAQVK